MFKEITVRLFYVMVFMKDDNNQNLEIMCNNILILSKYMAKLRNFSDFFAALQETFFNTQHFYQFKLLPRDSAISDTFLEHMLSRFLEFRDLNVDNLEEKKLTVDEVFQKFATYLLFYLNYETDQSGEVALKKCEKLMLVVFNLQLVTSNEILVNCGKFLNYFIKFLIPENRDSCPAIAKRMAYYMEKICEGSVLNHNQSAIDTVTVLSIFFEKNKFLNSKLKELSKETIVEFLPMIKLTLSLSQEPSRKACEIKSCEKNNKKHTVTNMTRMAMKLFEVYASKTKEDEIDENALFLVTQITIFHFDVLGRLTCSTKTSNEHNDIRRMFGCFSNRPKTNASKWTIKIFEVILKYVFTNNLQALVSPITTLLSKYYTENGDTINQARVEWLSILCADKEKGEAFSNLCYNWAVKKQNLSKEELKTVLLGITQLEFGFQTDLIPNQTSNEDVFTLILETISVFNHKSFRPIQESLIEMVMRKPIEYPVNMVSLLFYASDTLLITYRSEIQYQKREFLKKPKSDQIHLSLAILGSISYTIYAQELRKELKSIEISSMHSRELDLKNLSLKKEQENLLELKESLNHIEFLLKRLEKLSLKEKTQIMGILKRNIRHFQLSGWQVEEILCCKFLFQVSRDIFNLEGQLLAMGNLVNNIYFLTKSPESATMFPGLLQTIVNEGYPLIFSKLKTLKNETEPVQILVVFCVCNMIKLNADLGKKHLVYDQLQYLRSCIDSVKSSSDLTVLDMQFNLVSYQLFLKYSSESNVNHLLVIREIFSSIRLLHKLSDLYSLHIYDVLVEMISFGVPRYETKGMEFYICTVLKFFMDLGSATRVMDVMLMYCNWGLYCENVDKCQPVMEYVVDILDLEQSKIKAIDFLQELEEKDKVVSDLINS